MVGSPPFVEEPVDTREAIMRATYRALCEHGYADLTIQRIGDEFEKSKSLLYHHYDGKDDLLLEFLEFLLERFEEAIPPEDVDGADEHLAAIVDHVLPTREEAEARDFTRAMIELRAQAAHDADYRDHFTRSDRFFRDRIAALVRSGIEEGTVRETDPEAAAAFVQTVLGGAMFHLVTADEDAADAVRAELRAYLRWRLHAPDPDG